MRSNKVARITVLLALALGSTSFSSNHLTNSVVKGQSINEPRKLDSYGDLKTDDELARLDNLAVALGKEPSSQAAIIAYGGSLDPPGTARRLALRVKYYLTEMRGIEPKRITAIGGGHRD